jgi:hypothetical protein
MAVYSDLSIDQGADFSAEIVVEDITGTVADLTGFTGAGQIRKTYSSSTAVNFGVTVTNAGGGVITVTLTNTQTNAMKAGRYVYDVEITKTSNGEKTRVVEGQVTINPGVTQ